jgi:hypothetical protein
MAPTFSNANNANCPIISTGAYLLNDGSDEPVPSMQSSLSIILATTPTTSTNTIPVVTNYGFKQN